MICMLQGCAVLTQPLAAPQVFDPVLAWARDRFSAEFQVDDSIFGAPQPEEAVAALRQYLESAAYARHLGTYCC